MLTYKDPKAKSCEVCERVFVPERIGQLVCRPACAIARVRNAKKAERESIKARKEAIKSRADWAREAQTAFNAFIRARDDGLPCISCGRHHQGQWHAGHYLSTGARPELRYTESNVHRQCAPCNTHLSGNAVLYRIGLIERIGLEAVEWLEGPHDLPKWTQDDYKAIRDHYKQKLKDTLKGSAC